MDIRTSRRSSARHIEPAQRRTERRSRSRLDHDAYYRAEHDGDPYREASPA